MRVPDLGDSEVAVRLEGDVVLKSLRQPIAGLLQTADRLVVLIRGHSGRCREADEDPIPGSFVLIPGSVVLWVADSGLVVAIQWPP